MQTRGPTFMQDKTENLAHIHFVGRTNPTDILQIKYGTDLCGTCLCETYLYGAD